MFKYLLTEIQQLGLIRSCYGLKRQVTSVLPGEVCIARLLDSWVLKVIRFLLKQISVRPPAVLPERELWIRLPFVCIFERVGHSRKWNPPISFLFIFITSWIMRTLIPLLFFPPLLQLLLPITSRVFCQQLKLPGFWCWLCRSSTYTLYNVWHTSYSIYIYNVYHVYV